MSNKSRKTLYIGVSNDLERRVLEHKAGIGSKFTSKYKIVDLLYFEEFEEIAEAIAREKQLKNWHRAWKWNLIKTQNPTLIDVSEEWYCKEDIDEIDK